MDTTANLRIKNDSDGDIESSLRYRHLTCEIAENAEFARNHYVIVLTCSEFDGDILPGQFVNLKCDSEKYGKLYRPFSVMNFIRQKRQIEIYYHVVGEGSRWLAKQKTGTKLKILLPLGNAFSIPKEAVYIALIAGGVGVAPLLFLNKYLIESRNDLDISFLMGARNIEGLCIPLFNKCGVIPEYATDDGSFGYKGLVTDLLEKRLNKAYADNGKLSETFSDLPDPLNYVIACGPTPMMAAVQSLCAGQVAGEVSLEERMACGIGACMGCVARIKDDDGNVHYAPICTNGPVVKLDRVEF